MIKRPSSRANLLFCTALATGGLVSIQAHAQEVPGEENDGLDEIIVTAQKREQSVQDVPIAVTALSGDALVANRVVNVTDLNGLAPGVTVRTSAGGSALPSFTVRGSVSYGVVPGSDKQVSIYLDGVYISAARGSIFDLPDVERIELLRGPQGTLFGRNATAGAVSITTRDPLGEAAFRGDLTVGNYNQRRVRASIDLPKAGPFSGYVSFVHDERRGDIRNAGAGRVWDRTAALSKPVAKVRRSPKYLGSKNTESFFGALKFEPTDDFSMVYKYDRAEMDGTPEGTGLIGINPARGAVNNFINALVNSQATPVNFARHGKRPKVVNNSFVIPSTQRVSGHSLTARLDLGDITLRNILAYRKSYIFATSALDGISALPITAAAAPLFGLPAALVGQPWITITTQPEGKGSQWSNELQLNYDSDLLTLTAGALWFHSVDRTGIHGMQNSPAFTTWINGVAPLASRGQNFNKQTSIAAYTQVEWHVSDQLDIVAGARVTKDHKSGSFTFGSAAPFTVVPFDYKKTKPNFLIGANYKPIEDILLYAKYSTAFVSGGSVAGIPFQPETAESVEGAIKAELLDRRLRANLAVYAVTYKHYQTAQAATNFPGLFPPAVQASIGTFIIEQGGPVKSRGFEFDFSAAPAEGLTFGGSLGYSKTTFEDVNPILVAASGGKYSSESFRPYWTGGLWGQYDTDPLFDEAYLSFRADGTYQSYMRLAQNPDLAVGYAAAIRGVPAYWILNGRVSLRDINIGPAKVELAAWGRNLTDNRSASFALDLARIIAGANYIPARTYGLDLSVRF